MLHRAPKAVLMSDPRVGDVPIQDCGEKSHARYGPTALPPSAGKIGHQHRG